MSKLVIGLKINQSWLDDSGPRYGERFIEWSVDGQPVRITGWSIESDWLSVVFSGQRRAYRLFSQDAMIEEVLGTEKNGWGNGGGSAT